MFKVMAWRGGGAVYFGSSRRCRSPVMLQLITILNRCHRFPGFIYQNARFSSDHKSIEIAVRPRKVRIPGHVNRGFRSHVNRDSGTM
jgi:hypothetical protein